MNHKEENRWIDEQMKQCCLCTNDNERKKYMNDIANKLIKNEVIKGRIRKGLSFIDRDYQSDFDEFYGLVLFDLMQSYNYDKNDSFMAYFFSLMKKRILDIYNSEHKNDHQTFYIENMKNEDNDDDSYIQYNGKPICADKEANVEEESEIESTVCSMYILVLNIVLMQKYQGNKRTQEEHRYNAMFFSEFTVKIIHHVGTVFEEIKAQEEKAFETMDCDFLNYIMEKVCNSFQMIFKTECKYSLPLANTVYIQYLDGIGAGVNKSTISRKKRCFDDIIREKYNEQ